MAASLLLRQGRAGALKTRLQPGVLRGLSSTVSLATKSGKSEKGLPPDPKKQSTPKNVVEPKARDKLLASHPAAGLSKKFSPPSSYPSVMNKGRKVASPDPDDIMPLTDEGGPRFLARKTLVEFPQKVPSPFQKQSSDVETHQGNRKAVEEASSSSSSSNSDSESEEEEHVAEIGTRVVSKAQRRSPKAEASAEGRSPQIVIAAKEKIRSQMPQRDTSYPEKAYLPKKKTVPQLKVEEGVKKQYAKEKQSQNKFKLKEIDGESQEPVVPKENLLDHTDSGLSPQPSPMPTLMAEEPGAEKQLQAAPSKTVEKNLANQVPEPTWKVTSQSTENVLEDRIAVGSLETVPAQSKDVFDEKIPVLSLEEKGDIIQESATQMEDPDNIQEKEPGAIPVEPFDNTTYKNLQHHDYTAYTFSDVNLDLLKFRMPQPASGRESPRH